MNKRGFLLAIVALSFWITVFELKTTQNQAAHALEQTKHQTIAIEQTSFERTVLENNTDYLVTRFFTRALQTNAPPNQIKAELARELHTAFQIIQNQTPSIQFYSARVNPTDYSTAMHAPQTPLTPARLETQLSVFTFALQNQSVAGTIEFTGGPLQNQTVYAQITVPNNTGFFLVPIHYSQTVIQ